MFEQPKYPAGQDPKEILPHMILAGFRDSNSPKIMKIEVSTDPSTQKELVTATINFQHCKKDEDTKKEITEFVELFRKELQKNTTFGANLLTLKNFPVETLRKISESLDEKKSPNFNP